MNKIVKFFHELRHPHCEHCKDEYRDYILCESCESLKMENARLTDMVDKLLDRVLEKPVVETTSASPMAISKPSHVPWNVRRQLLESEDRKKAQLMKDAPTPLQAKEIDNNQIEQLEKELQVDNAL